MRPAMTPLNVEPITMPTMFGASCGAEISADRPSKLPRNPPSSIANTGLFIAPSNRLISTADGDNM